MNDRTSAARSMTDADIAVMVAGLSQSISALAIAVAQLGTTLADEPKSDLVTQLRAVNDGLVRAQ